MDVFVSYARPDEGHAVRVADALRSEGYNVWRDGMRFPPIAPMPRSSRSG